MEYIKIYLVKLIILCYINYHSIIIVIMIIVNFLFKIIVILLCNGDFILKLLEISLFFF
jgi:hypothetical protein